MARKLLTALFIGGTLVIAGCNTVRGAAQDVAAAEALGLQRTYFTKLLRQKQIPGRQPKPGAPSSSMDRSSER